MKISDTKVKKGRNSSWLEIIKRTWHEIFDNSYVYFRKHFLTIKQSTRIFDTVETELFYTKISSISFANALQKQGKQYLYNCYVCTGVYA